MSDLDVIGSELDARARDHRYRLLVRRPATPQAALLWLPALGVAARHYTAFAEALARRGIAVCVHEWRGNGTSDLRADRWHDWGYRELLLEDIPASIEAMRQVLPGLPMRIGGHSLGGQLAACTLGLQREGAVMDAGFAALWLVASGAPYWRAFPSPTRYGLPLAYRFLPWLAQRCGALPGRRIGFGGEEARSLIRDWARTALSGRYAAEGIEVDVEAGMRAVSAPISSVVLSRDWLAPRSSLEFLLGKFPVAPKRVVELTARELGLPPDHFAWMKAPGVMADALMGRAVG